MSDGKLSGKNDPKTAKRGRTAATTTTTPANTVTPTTADVVPEGPSLGQLSAAPAVGLASRSAHPSVALEAMAERLAAAEARAEAISLSMTETTASQVHAEAADALRRGAAESHVAVSAIRGELSELVAQIEEMTAMFSQTMATLPKELPEE